MWSKPWSYKEGLIIGAGLLVIGALLQITVGGINWNLFAWPVNLIVLSVYIIVLIAMHLLRKRVYLFEWLSHYSAAVSSLGGRYDGGNGSYPAGSFRSCFE